MRLDRRLKELEAIVFPSTPSSPYILRLREGESLEEGRLREGIPDTENGYPAFVIGVSFV